MNDQSIIVGTDGTGSSTAAVVWAATEAERRGLPLRIVHAFDWDWRATQSDIGGYYVQAAQAVAESIVTAARNQARTVAPGITIETSTLIGHAYPRLLEVSRGAAMLVVGNRGRGGFAGLLLTSSSPLGAASIRRCLSRSC
jgi:nucleotide-binding universal stress UspA family protein